MSDEPKSVYDTGLGTTLIEWELVSDLLTGEMLPESINEAIYALREGQAFIVLKPDPTSPAKPEA